MRPLLPYDPLIQYSGCEALQLGYGLFIPCEKPCDGGALYCSKCIKNKLAHGTLTDRLNVDLFEYVSPSGKKVEYYGTVMEKWNISKEMVMKWAENANRYIPEYQFKVEQKKRGRTKKIIEHTPEPERQPVSKHVDGILKFHEGKWVLSNDDSLYNLISGESI